MCNFVIQWPKKRKYVSEMYIVNAQNNTKLQINQGNKLDLCYETETMNKFSFFGFENCSFTLTIYQH